MKISITPRTLQDAADACDRCSCVVADVDTSCAGMTLFALVTGIGNIDLCYEPSGFPRWFAAWTGASDDTILADHSADSADEALCGLFKHVADLVKQHTPKMPL